MRVDSQYLAMVLSISRTHLICIPPFTSREHRVHVPLIAETLIVEGVSYADLAGKDSGPSIENEIAPVVWRMTDDIGAVEVGVR